MFGPNFTSLRLPAAVSTTVYTLAIQPADETPMAQTILRWGNSLAFRIPAAIARQMQIDEGAEVEFRVDGKRLVIEKADEVPKFTHQELVKSLRKAKKNLIDLGSPRGKEIL